MRVAFRASNAAFEAQGEGALVCGVTGEHEYLVFQRHPEDGEEDRGVHLEYGDQANGDYGRIAECRLTRERLHVDLSGGLGNLEEVDGFDVALAIEDESFEALRDGLRQVFRGKAALLQIE